MAPSLPLIPRRVSKSYENVKLKGQESVDLDQATTTSVMDNRPPIPPRRGYENVELKESKKEEKERGTGDVHVATISPGVNPPIPLKRSRSPQPPNVKEYCPVVPPMPARRSREKTAAENKTKLFKVTSMPYCPVTPDSPQLPVKGKSRSVSNPVVLPLEENDDSANCDKPSPYYSLPPDSLSPMADIDARFQIDDSDEGEGELNEDGGGGLELYLTLGEDEIQSKTKSSDGEEKEKAIKSPMQYCPPPLPPKVCLTIIIVVKIIFGRATQ